MEQGFLPCLEVETGTFFKASKKKHCLETLCACTSMKSRPNLTQLKQPPVCLLRRVKTVHNFNILELQFHTGRCEIFNDGFVPNFNFCSKKC